MSRFTSDDDDDDDDDVLLNGSKQRIYFKRYFHGNILFHEEKIMSHSVSTCGRSVIYR